MLDNTTAHPSTTDTNARASDDARASTSSLPIARVFSLTATPYEWREVTVDFSRGTQLRCRVPVAWSDNAAATLMSKYAVRAGVPDAMGGVDGREVDAERIFDRLVAGWRAAAIEHGYWQSGDLNLAAFCNEVKAMLEQQVAAPNSPQWFNTGIAVQYGITAGSDGHYYADVDAHGTATAHACSDSLTHPQISACFIQSVDDKLVGEGGIMDLWQREARLFKYGSGSGANYSRLRGKGEGLSRGGASSGLLSFLRVGDRSAGAIKSGGTTRRSARMVIVDVDHPDIEDFITWKTREDAKIRALHDAGFGDRSSFEDEATETVSGQNANNSVAVTDAFMSAALNDEPWTLTRRVDGKPAKVVSARALWQQIAEAAHACADPGLQFADTINAWHTCKNDGPIRGSNPCQPAFAPVLTPDGIRTMGDLKLGDTVWSGQRWTKVKRKIATGVKPVQVYHTTAGRVICTADHRVFQEGQRMPAAEAHAIDSVQGPRREFIDPLIDAQDVMDGLYFGDGSWRGDSAEGERCLLAIGKDDGCYHTSEVRHLIIKAKPGYTPYAWAVKSTLAELPYTYERVVPEQFYQGNVRKVRGFLRGLYSANGSVVGIGKLGRVTLKAASFAVISAVQEMLSALGIRSYYTTNKANEVEFANGTYLCKQSYDLNITTDAARFFDLIGFVHPYKTAKLAQLVASRETLPVRAGKSTYEIKRVEELGEMPVFDIEVEADEHSYWSGGHLISNCSEYVFLDDTACNLASINLARLHVDGAFRVAAYEHAIRVWTIVLDISVSMAGYPTAEIARRSMLYRTLGLGYAALGELLVLMGQGYGTTEGRSTAAYLTETLTLVAYSTSVDLAERLGAFPRYDANRHHVLSTIYKHADAGDLRRRWDAVLERARAHGVRNAQVTLLAPCGTIGIVMDCETTGVEPFYSDTTFKSLAGGGMMRLASKRFADALTLQGYDVDAHTRRAWTVEQGRVREYVWIEPPPDLADVLVCASDLTPEQHVAMMQAVQPFLSGAISKTVNMPSESTVDDVARMYTLAWRSGLKSIAIYRDGCKPAQPLQGRKPAPGVKTFPNRAVAETFLAASQRAGFDATTLHASAPKLAARALARGDRQEPPAIASAIKHRVELSGHTFYLTLAEYSDGALAEVFVTCSRTGSAISGWVNTWAKVFSLALQHGTPLAVLVSAMSGESFEPVGYHDARPVQSPVDCFARIIAARYLSEPSEAPDTEHVAPLPALTPALPSAKPTGATCTGCGSSDLTRSGACFVCRKCGSTTGCS